MGRSSAPFERNLWWMALSICLIVMTPAWATSPAGADQTRPRRWKGNLHTHTFWSDGDCSPRTSCSRS